MSCDGCLLNKSCGLVKCPHCGFESAREPVFIQRLRRFFGAHKSKDVTAPPEPEPSLCDTKRSCVTLKDLNSGDSASIEAFMDHNKMRKFTSLGILPGSHVTVLRRHPAVVLRVGYSEFAFDHDLAGSVKVQPM